MLEGIITSRTTGPDIISWNGLMIERGEVHIETADSWAARECTKKAAASEDVKTLCGGAAVVRSGQLLVVNDQDAIDVFQDRRVSGLW